MPSNLICCHCFWRFINQLVQFKCDTLACRSQRTPWPAKPNLAKEKQAALLPPFLFRNPRKEWTHGKSTLALWRNASYLFLSLLTSLIATSCSEDAMVNQNLPFCLATLKQSKSATRRAKISTYQRPDPASALTSPEEAVSWLEILPMNPAVRFRAVWNKKDPQPATFMSSNKTDNMSVSYRQTPCIDYHVKQHSWGTDLKTSQEKNADIGSVQEGVWFKTKSKRKLSWAENEYNTKQENRAAIQ